MFIRPKNNILSYLLAFFIVAGFCSANPKQHTWLAIGDSITYLNDHLDETGNRVKQGYLTRVCAKIPDLTYRNEGRNGWTSGGIADHIDFLNGKPADVYTIFLGTNDWWQGRAVGTMADYLKGAGNASLYASFRIIIGRIKQISPTARIVLITPMQRNDFVYLADLNNNAHGSYKAKNNQTLEQFADAILEIGKYENIPVIDLYHHPKLQLKDLVKFKRLKDPETGVYKKYKFPASTQIPFNPQTDDYPYPINAISITYDGLHPSDKGNAIIASEIAKLFVSKAWFNSY